MILSRYLFKRVTIIGIGLMGGSLGMAIKKNRLAKEVVGLHTNKGTLAQAAKQKAIDISEVDIVKGVKYSDLIILAVPVESIIKILTKITPHLKRGCIVTDVGSAKVEVVEAAEKMMPSRLFVGSHPLVGSEKKGIEFAKEDLYQNARCILTPTKNTHNTAKQKVKNLWTKVGAKVKIMAPEEHDEILAYTSHLPHLLAFGMMETIPEKYLEFAGKGLLDTSRVASSSPQIWHDICMANSKNILKALDESVKNLSEIRKAIIGNDKKVLIDHFQKAKTKRDGII